ncbi:hypothetical protein DL770_005530 [Monosporascus sp. CRB-9-2]|nr:hypothetical protein DL770_005530 [Monosporascus sp. CRB-9-2]
MVSFSGDIIQVGQALKESKPEPTGELEISLVNLWSSLKELHAYCNEPHVEKSQLGAYHFPRLLKGLWQLPYPAWGSGTAEEQRTGLARLIESGLTAADMAGHYPAPAIGDQVYAATKWCVFGPVGHPITTEWVLAQVKECCRRFGGQVELPQFHWSDCFDIINMWGSWTEFQGLLAVLSAVAREHGLVLTNVVRRWFLQQPVAGAVIVGTRLGVAAHGDENVEVFGFELEDSDLATINAVPLGGGP